MIHPYYCFERYISKRITIRAFTYKRFRSNSNPNRVKLDFESLRGFRLVKFTTLNRETGSRKNGRYFTTAQA